MRLQFLTPALLLLAACRDTLPERLPPSHSFAYPSGMVHLPSAAPGGNGTLYVASSNFDKFFDLGAVMAVNLDSAGEGGVLSRALPTFGVPPESPIPEIPLGVPDASKVYIQSMSGDMVVYRPATGGADYLFVPSRAEGDYLQVVQANGAELTCTGTDSRKCLERAFSLTEAFKTLEETSQFPDGLPGAPAPMGAAIRDGDLWITHVVSALQSEGDNRQDTASTYVVRASAQELVDRLLDPAARTPLRLPVSAFVPLNVGASLAGAHSVALGTDFAFLSGRVVTSGQGSGGVPPFLLRAISRTDTNLFSDPDLRASYPDIEARGLALNESGTRLYMAARAAGSTLLIMDVASTPTTLDVSVVRAIDTLPPGASTVKVVSRGPGRGDLVLISCTAAGVLAIYDDEVGNIVAQVPDLGVQPYAIAVEPRATIPVEPPGAPPVAGARVYVANFGDGQVSVIDIPSLDSPQQARVVARLGRVQRCAPGDTDDRCPENEL